MESFVRTGIAVLLGLVAFSCEGDYRHRAIGGFGEAIVIMDSTEWDSETAQAIRDSYGQAIETLPNVEALFDLHFRDFDSNEELEQLKRFKNIIIAAPINDSSNVARFIRALLDEQVEQSVRRGESFAFPLENHWYRDQWTMILTSTSDSALAKKVRSSQETLVSRLMQRELQRWTYEIYQRGEQTEISDSLWANHGWKIRVQHDWFKSIDTTYIAEGDTNHFFTMRRILPENDRLFWIWWRDDIRDITFLDNEWINAKRDSLMEKWIRGTREGSYVTTEYRRPVETESFSLNGDLAFETLGTWRMTGDAMGGPFANLTVYDEETDRLFIMEFWQFAPKYEKRRFVRQFRAMLRTFESDSTWSGNKPQTAAASVTVLNQDKLSFIEEALNDRRAEDRFRRLIPYDPAKDGITIKKEGKTLINFSSNDYLGLSRHPEVVRRVSEFIKRYGAGSQASRLISGTYEIHSRVEEKLAGALNKEAALLFNSGFQANSTLISTLTDRRSLILADKLSHNSLLQGALLSRATFQRYEHNDPEHLQKLLIRAREQSYNRVLVITETVFSMDGDRSPIEEISQLTQEHNALLFVDDAHAAGVWGRKGLGLASDVPGVDILLGTCGKAFGSFGAYVACSEKMKDYLVNFCPGFIYTTALPPAVAGAIDAALDIIPALENERKAFHDRITETRKAIQNTGFATGPSSTQIIPIIIGDDRETLDMALWLESQGILATAIRPPTVPEQSSRIRITLSMRHTDEHIEQLVTALKIWRSGKS